MAPRWYLLSDKLSETAVQIFRDRGIDVTFDPAIGKDKDRLLEVIGDYDGLAIRSATKVTENGAQPAAPKLKVIGRAGIGVDNVDIPAASKKGVIVMNTALRQLDHHRRARDRDDVRRRPAGAGGERLDPCGQVGKIAVHGGGTVVEDPRRRRRGQHPPPRLDRDRPRTWPQDEGHRL